MSAGDVLIRASDLALGYGRQAVLRGVNLEVRAGEYWFLIGPNGAGKSTFVRALFGLVDVAAGRLWIDPERAGHERFGFVPQRCALNPSLPTTVRELVALGLVGLRLDAGARAARVAEALRQVGIGERADHDYWTLSGGQRQRVLLARALVRTPAVLVLDEPETGLDLAVETRLLELLLAVNRDQHVTMLYVSHDLASVRRYATHVALFHDGGVQAGRVGEIFARGNLERAYGIAVADAPAEPKPCAEPTS
jgi:ABC-type Mn2+/Zn2+ transport system ATPase subunit